MKQEQSVNLSDEEIIDFMANLQNNPINRSIEDEKVVLFGFYGISGFGFLLAALIGPAFGLFPLSIELLYPMAFIWGLGTLCFVPKFVRMVKDGKEFNGLSNGKITYKKFKELKKNGVIKEWQNKFAKEIELKALEKDGVTIEEYIQGTETAILDEVKGILSNEKIAKLDSERVAKEVKKIIDESNERQG